MDIKTVVQNMINAGESEENIAKVIQSLSPKKVKEEKTIVHADALDMETEVSDGWFSMEEDAAKFFTKHYQNQGLNVGFKEAKVGHNALQMQVNGKDFGEIITLHQGGKAMDFGEIQKHIQFKIDDAAASGALGEEFGDKESSTKRTKEILSLIPDANMLESDDTGEGRAELAHALDKAQGIDVQFDGRINEDGWGNEVDVFDKFGNRRSTETQNVLTKGKEVFGEIFGAISGEGYDQYIGDLSGGVELEDGTYVPYSYIWDRRKELLELKQDGLGLQTEYVKEGDKLVQTFKYDENSDMNSLYNKKISEEGFGSEGALDDYIGDNAFVYFSPGEQEIRLKHIELEGIEDEAERELIKADINKKWKELYPDLSDSDIEDLTLYDKDGNFLRIKKPKIEQRGDVTEEETLIENEADELARENINDLDYLVKKRQEAYLRLILLAKRVSGNKDKVSDQTNYYAKQFGEMFDFSNDALIKDLSQLESIAKFEDIFAISDALGEGRTLKDVDIGILNPNLGSDGKPSKYNITNETLSNLPGGSALAEEYNKALLDFKVLSRSVDLNLDINQTPEEGLFTEIVDDLGKSIAGTGIVNEVSQDEVRDAYRGILEHDGYEVPEHVIESSFWKNGRLGKNNATRDNIESGAEIVTDLAPLLIELAVFKKLGGLKKLQTILGSAKNSKGLRTGLIGRLTNGKRFQGKVPRFLVDKMIAPGVITAAEWASAESLGELATGGAWKAHTIDWEKGETNLTMPIAMGMSAGMFGAFSGAAMKGFERYVPGGKRFLANVKDPNAWQNAKALGIGTKKAVGTPLRMAGQGATATALLVTAETAQAITDDLLADGKVDWAAKWKTISDTDHLIQTWMAMTILSGKDVVPKAREAYRADVARLKRNTEATEKAYKELGVDKNSTETEIDQAAERKIKETEERGKLKMIEPEQRKLDGKQVLDFQQESGLTNAEVKAKVEEIKKAQKDLQSDLRIKDAKAAAISAGRYYEDWVKPNYDRMQNIKNKPPNEWTIDDYNAISDLTFDQMYDVLRRNGMEPNTAEFKLAEDIHASVKHLDYVIKELGIDAKLPEFREEYIRNTLSININDSRIKQLKKIIKDGKNVGLAKVELNKLEEANKITLEKNITLDKRAGVEYEVRLKAEVAAAKVLAESLGANIKTYNAKEWKEAGFEEAEGFYREVDSKGEIHLNLDEIRKTGNLGAPIHEVIHHVLRNAITKTVKLKGGKTKKVVTEKGMEIIDGLMQKFSPKEREIIQKRIDDNYRYDETGKEKAKEDYYDEYITGIGDAIKTKQIKYDQSKFRKIGKLIYPILKPLMPNLYDYKLSKTSSAEATKDLFNMLGDIHLSSSSKRVQKALQKLAETNPKKAAEMADKAIEKKLSKTKEKEIQDLGNEYRVLNKKGKEFLQKSIERGVFDAVEVKKYMKKNNLSEEGYFKETADNKYFSAKKSKDLWDEKGADKVLGEIYGDLENLAGSKAKEYEGTPDFSKEDFISNTVVEMVIHTRNFKPGENNNLSAWINSQLKNKALESIKPKTGIIKGKFEKQIGGEEIRDIESKDMTAEEIYDAKQAAKAIIENATNLRKSLVNEKGEHYITESFIKEVENATMKTLMQKLPEIPTKEFKKALSDSYDSFLRDKMVQIMGKGKEYDTFLENTRETIHEYMPKETLIQLERLVHSKKILAKYPNAKKIFTTKRRITKPTEVDLLVSKELLPKDVSRTSGPNLITKLEAPGIREHMAFFRGKYTDPITGKTESMLDILGYEVNESQLNNRKSKLGGELSINMAFDKTIETMRLPEVMKRRREIENTTSEQAQLEIAEIAKRIDRNPDMKFSKNKVKDYENAASVERDMNYLLREIRLKGREEVYDSKGKLLDTYKDKNISKFTSDFILDLDNRGLIYPEPYKSEIVAQQRYLQGLSSSIRSGSFETIPIQYGIELGKPFGLEVLTKKVTEGGYPDFHSTVHGVPFNVEVKMFDSQLPRTAVGATLNFTTGKHSFKGIELADAQMQGMLTEVSPALKNWQDFVLKEMQQVGINIKEITNTTKVPEDIYLKAKNEGLQVLTSITKPFENGLDYIRDKYAAKTLKDGTSVSNHYIEVQSTAGKELGLYKISDFNPLGLKVPKLDAKVNLKLRFSATSSTPVNAPKGYEKFHKSGQKYYSPSMAFIPVMNMRSISKSSPYSISVKSKFMKLLKSPEFVKLKKLNPKEVTDKITKNVQSIVGKKYSKSTKKEIIKDMETIDKAVNLGRLVNKKKKGMSAWDFDDTLAYTKGGVRYTLPNPSGKPQPKKKVIFVAGGAGSGKSNVIKQLGLEKQGFKIVNQDISLEWLMKNHGLPKDMRDFTTEQKSKFGSLSHQARSIALRKRTKFQGKGDGVIVDGTGASLNVMKKNVKEFTDKGYDVQMMFVETSKDVAVARNKARKERSLSTKIVEGTWEKVQGNKKAYQELFGERFAEVNTDNLKMKDPMPPELVESLDAFTKGYIKARLNAGEFADKGAKLKEQGAEFDFAEFDVVTGGKKGPFFQKALDRVKKFGSEHQYIITARPPEAQVPIHEFLKSQGLNIPLENIKGLGNSTGEAKAMWMLEKFSEGYNDMYFADDALGNVKAVKDVLEQLDVKSKVQLAMRGEDAKIESKESVKDVDRLDAPENYDNIKYSKSHRSEYENTISKHRPDLVKEGKVSQTIDAMFDFVDGLNIPGNKKRKYEQVTTKWLATSNIKLKEDSYKIKEAVELAEKHKEDIFSYKNPNEIIEKYAGKAKTKPTDPNTVKEFAKGTVTNKEYGITEHIVENTKEGQLAVRKVMDTHFGENSNPWCLAQKKDGKLTDDAWMSWRGYEKGPKSMVFQNGKLIAFKGSEQYWDRMDNATDAPVVQIKEGRVTKKVELVPIGGGKASEFVRETRTVSKDKNTVTTEYATETEHYEVGTTVVENRVNGITVKKTTSRPSFDKQGNDVMQVMEVVNYNKKGKATSNKNFEDGKLIAINTYGRPFGEAKVEQIIKEKGDQIEFMDTNRFGRSEYFAEALVESKITEIGFQLGRGIKLESVIKTSPDGEIRLDLNKLRKIDPDVKGLPKETAGVEQFKFSKNKKNLSKDFNKILEEVKGIGKEKTFSLAKAKLVGKGKGKYKIFGTPGAEDFAGLVTYAFAGKGKQGEMHKKFFEENLQKPFNRAYNDIHSRKQNISNDYKALRKAMPEVRSRLNEAVDGVYTVDNAIRVHLWNKAGIEIPGLSKTDLKTLTDFVRKDGELTLFAEQLSQITMLKEGYLKPADYWLGENITIDMNNVVDRVYRKEALAEFVENREAIFGKWKGGEIVGENMNKIEAAYGPKHREALENILWRMENGTNRKTGADSNTNKWMNWVNSATGTIMFFNQKSAVLQTISSLNYVNGTFNNPLRAAQAFANQKQYWADFVKIFGSDMMVQRRSGLKINIEANELIERVGSGEGGFAKFRAYLLEKGFIPTKYADSFAIASGGATYYRNSIRKYEKEGLSTKEAEKKAWEDFTEMTEATQQSSRPDLISMQQASALGRPILAFANTPMQMFRRHKRRIQDIANGRGNTAENVGSALYYGFAQTLLFSYLANAMFAVDDESDDPEDIEFAEKKKSRHVNTIADSYLRGMGTGGASVAALKNGIMSFINESKKDHNADYGNTVIDMLNVSPPIGSKARKLYSAGKSYMYNKEAVHEMGLDFDNPATMAIANVISAFTNMPTDRAVMKIQNIRDASMGDFENWQRIAMFMGVNKWQLGVGEKGPGEIRVEEVETRVKGEKKTKKKEIKQQENQVLENQFKNEQKKEKKQGKKDVTCSSVVNGRRCNKKVKGKGGKCTIHESVEMHPSGESIQCRRKKSNGKRCKVTTFSKSGLCYYHD
jgi:hypothetical protein